VSSHIFVDETKDRDYLLVASAYVSSDIDELRKLMRALVLRGQRRVHMKKESEPRKRAIACLGALVVDAAHLDNPLLVLEQDDSLLDWDRRQLYALTREAQVPLLRYEHRRASVEQLLAIPDAIAWCWAKGGDWRRRIEPAVTTVKRV